jgi:hypothetical protein
VILPGSNAGFVQDNTPRQAIYMKKAQKRL